MSFETRSPNFYHSERQELASTFAAVIDAALRIRELATTAAQQIDDDVPAQRLYNASAVEYIADVENTTRKALSVNGVLSEKLWNSWVAIVNREPVPAIVRETVVQRCGRLYKVRGLHPNKYFRLDRYGSAPRYREAVAA